LQVIDISTGDDVTKVILTQIILDKHKDKEEGLSLERLFQLVRESSSSYMEVMKGLMSIGPKAYEKTIGKMKSTLSPNKDKDETFTSTDDEISALKKRLADVETKLARKTDTED